jgi:hypothetical protein
MTDHRPSYVVEVGGYRFASNRFDFIRSEFPPVTVGDEMVMVNEDGSMFWAECTEIDNNFVVFIKMDKPPPERREEPFTEWDAKAKRWRLIGLSDNDRYGFGAS